MHASAPLPLEILQHAPGLGRLARQLVRDDASADDVVQETWLAALQQRPSAQIWTEGSSPGAWLTRVLRSRVWQRHRGEARRAEREARAARDERLPSVAEVVAERAVLAQVVEEVLALEEPYQSAVWMRYFDDLQPRDIAQRTGTPVATIKSRIHRGLGQLRERLDAEHGGSRASWAMALVSYRGAPTAVTPAAANALPRTGGLAGARAAIPTWSIGAAASTLAAGALLWPVVTQARPDDGTRAAGLPSQETLGHLGATSSGTLVNLSVEADSPRQALAGDGLPGRRDAAPNGAAAAVLVRPFSVLIHVRNEYGLPVENAEFLLAPKHHSLNVVGRTDALGTAQFQWDATGDSVEVAFGIRASNRWSGLHAITVPRNAERTVHIELAPRTALPRQARVASAAGAFNVELEEVVEQAELRPRLVANDYLSLAPGAIRGADSRFRLARHPSESLAWRNAALGSLEVAHVAYNVARESYLATSLSLVVDSNATVRTEFLPPAPPRVVHGKVLDALGLPVANATVRAWRNGHLVAVSGTDANGAFATNDLAPGPLTFTAGDSRVGRGSCEVAASVVDGALTLRLEVGLSLEGRVVGPDGMPLAGWRVSATRRDGALIGLRRTYADDEGYFRIANCDPGAYDLSVGNASTPVGLDSLVASRARPGTGPLVLSALPAASTLCVEVLSSSENHRPELRLWNPSTNSGSWLGRASGGTYSSADLPAGRYELWLGDGLGRWSRVATPELDGVAPLTLGPFHAPIAGSATVGYDRPGSFERYEVRRLGPGGESYVFSSDEPPVTADVALALGNYVLVLVDGSGRVEREAFEILPHAPFALSLPEIAKASASDPSPPNAPEERERGEEHFEVINASTIAALRYGELIEERPVDESAFRPR